ncbi:MAG: pyridoxal 5'-phosphate synthase glutaminase subunit PdxT [Nitrososphaeria archaeon]
MKHLTIGVFGLQGDIEEHVAITKITLDQMRLDGAVIWAKTEKDIENLDGLIIPGGESTVIGRLADYNKALKAVKERIYAGMPVLGTCAGFIMLAKKTSDRVVADVKQPILGVMDVVVERNAFGRQKESFEVDLEIPALGKKTFRGIFIRSPAIRETGPEVETLCKLKETIVAAQQHNIIGIAFHPELTNDTRLHKYFIKTITKIS